ncbi:phage/plasmid primase, P4 family [Ochrobactrum sp. BD67]
MSDMEPTSILDHMQFSWLDDTKNHLEQQLERRGALDEIQYGQLLADALAGSCGQFIFCHGEFWAYIPKTGLYVPVRTVKIQNLLYDLHNTKGHEGLLHKLSKNKISNIVSIAANYLTNDHFFDEAPLGLATEDSYLLLSENKIEVKDHSPQYRARWKVSAPFSGLTEPDETASKIAEMVGGTENAQTFFEVLGVAMFGLGTRFSRALVFVGEGANGKSTLVNIMCQMIPAYMRSSVPLNALKTEYDRVQLDGKILNTLEELPALSLIDVQLVKNIITGGAIQARQIGNAAFTMYPKAQHIICTNQLPLMHENNEALRRRFIVIRLNQTIPEDRRDLDFAQKFFNEHKAALLLLAVRALEEALKRGRIYEPNTSKLEVARWLDRNDVVTSFIKECVEQTGNPKDRIPVDEMLEACIRYANMHGFPPPSSPRQFGTRMEAAGFVRGKSSTKYWVAVRFTKDTGEDRENLTTPPPA